MAKIQYSVAYAGMLANYLSATGLVDIRTGLPELGGGMNVGDYFDLTEQEAQAINSTLHTGRYRFVQVASAATAANIKQGTPVGIALGTTVQNVSISSAGSGQTAGTYTVTSSTSGGTVAAVASVVVSGAGTVISATLLNPGAGFTSVPTFTVAAGGTPGTILAQLTTSPNVVTSFDASANSLATVRGVFLASLTAAQITAGAFVFIQELGIATILVTTATNTAAGAFAAATTAGTITTTTAATAIPVGFFATTLDLAAAGTLIRAELDLPVRQG